MTVWAARTARWPFREAGWRSRCLARKQPDMKPSEALAWHRATIRRVAESRRARNPRVFGSALHGMDTEQSDLDLLVDPEPRMSLFDIGAIRRELRELLGLEVQVLTPHALPDSFRDRVLAEARPV